MMAGKYWTKSWNPLKVKGGGESGPGARPMQPDWVRSIRDQCAAAGGKFFMKQMGGFPNKRDIPEDLRIRELLWTLPVPDKNPLCNFPVTANHVWR